MSLTGRLCVLGAVLLLSVSFARSARADGAGFYVNGSVGGLVLEGSTLSGSGGAIDVGYVPGYLAGGALGYELPLVPIRLEGEVTYRVIDSDTLTSLSGTPLVSGVPFSASGTFNVVSAMGNAYAYLPVPFGLEPYVGVGVGYARVNADKLTAGGVTLVDGSANALAYQGIAGVEFDFIPGPVDVGLEYRYFVVNQVTLGGPSGNFGFDYRSHTAMLRLRVSL